MARKSPWQEFAENFKNVYGTFKQIGQDIETSRIMDDEKFMAEGGQGFGLKGDALEEARYKALGDIYTKYGNAKQGLEMRQGLANLEEKRRSNDLQEAILQNQINIQGNLAEQQALANLGYTGAQTSNLNANTKSTLDRLPYQVGILQNEQEAGGLAIDKTKATQNSEIAKILKQNEQAIDEADTEIALSGLKWQKRYAEVEAGIEEAKAKGNAAALEGYSNELFLSYAEDYADNKFKTGKEASEAFISIVGAFDPVRAAKLSNEYSTEEVGAIANDGLKIQNEVARFVQDRDLAGLRKYFDDKNGDQFGVSLSQDAETGAIRMVELDAEGNPVRDIISAANEAEALQDLQALSTFGNGAAYAELLFDRKKKALELEKLQVDIDATESNTGLTDKKTEYQEILNDTTRYSTLIKNNNVQAQTELANAQVAKLKQDTEAESGLTYSDKQAQKAFNNFIGGTTYATLAQDLEPSELRIYTNRVKLGLGLLRQPPSGVTEEEWLAMSEADQALF